MVQVVISTGMAHLSASCVSAADKQDVQHNNKI